MKTRLPKCKHCKERFKPYSNSTLVKYCLKTDECLKAGLKWAKEQKEIQRAKNWAKKKAKMKENIKSHSDYQNDLQKIINRIARLIDFGNPCMMCGNARMKRVNGCHYHSVGSNNSLRFNLFNIWAGCHSCNSEKGGNILGYDDQLIGWYGRNRWEFIKFGIREKYPLIKLSAEELKDKIKLAKAIEKQLKADLKVRQSIDRWELREDINKQLGIYL